MLMVMNLLEILLVKKNKIQTYLIKGAICIIRFVDANISLLLRNDRWPLQLN